MWRSFDCASVYSLLATMDCVASDRLQTPTKRACSPTSSALLPKRFRAHVHSRSGRHCQRQNGADRRYLGSAPDVVGWRNQKSPSKVHLCICLLTSRQVGYRLCWATRPLRSKQVLALLVRRIAGGPAPEFVLENGKIEDQDVSGGNEQAK